jgi:hypothetical protein
VVGEELKILAKQDRGEELLEEDGYGVTVRGTRRALRGKDKGAGSKRRVRGNRPGH